MYSNERKVNPNYPFSPTIEFCEYHDADSDVEEVMECHDCKRPYVKTITPEAKALFPTVDDVVIALNRQASESSAPVVPAKEHTKEKQKRHWADPANIIASCLGMDCE